MSLAASLTAPVRDSPPRRAVLRIRIHNLSAPAPVLLRNVLPCILAAGAPPRSPPSPDLRIFLHGILFFHLLHAALGPLLGAAEVKDSAALRAGPDRLPRCDSGVTDNTIVFAVRQLGDEAGAGVRVVVL